MEFGLYIHIPYCRSRCHYCDFHTQGGADSVPVGYIDALVRSYGVHAPAGRPLTVYFGGGTPGLLSPAQVGRLLERVNPAPGAEITLEVNPGGCDEARLAGFRAAGVNRLSVGVQTAREASLSRLGRPHTAKDAADLFAAARRAGFENISGDAMVALPGYTKAEFDETLALLRAGGAVHVSAYLLKLEPGTPFGQAPPAGLPNADETAAFYLHAVDRLAAAGYAQYEISNFAQPGFEGRHNLLYWDSRDWLGLGPGAHSSLSGRRFGFGRDTAAFLADMPPAADDTVTAEDYVMLRLRLAEGLDEGALHARFGTRLSPSQRQLLGRCADGGLARKTPGGWALTPRGMLVQNEVLARLFA